jgi:hypothetical protein
LWLALCGVASVTPSALAQPETYGEPDSSRFILIPPDADDWTKHFRLGVLVGLGISTDFKMNGTFNPSSNKAQKGIYDNGYVLPDSKSAGSGLTANWGYDNASQYDATAHTLTMTSTGQYTSSGSSHDDAGPLPGFELAYGMNYWYWRSARVGWEIGFGLLPIDISQNIPKGQNASVIQNTYTFDTGDIVLPGAPYHYSGGGDEYGAPISSSPSSTSTLASASGNITGSHELDVMLYTVRLGPSFYWDLTDKVGMTLGAGPALGIVSGSYKYDETITINGVPSRNQGQIDSTSVVYGGYVNGAVMYHVEDEGQSADFFIGAQYMPLGNATISGGGREGTLKLGGQIYLSAGINWAF